MASLRRMVFAKPLVEPFQLFEAQLATFLHGYAGVQCHQSNVFQMDRVLHELIALIEIFKART